MADTLQENLAQPTILIVDDESVDRMIMAELLKSDYRILLAKDGASAIEQARQHAEDISVILLDISMPGISGYDVLSALRSKTETARLQVVFVTSQRDDVHEEYGLRLGAADYLHKPIRPAIVAARVRNLVELAVQKRTLEMRAQQDGLTGIGNRRYFDESFERACRHASRINGPIGLALIDVDHFKLFNDHYGHLQGDDALKRVARTLTMCMRRPYDIAARYGGEEFVLLTPFGGIRGLVDRFQSEIEGLAIPHATSPTAPRLTVSCGAVLAHAQSTGVALKRADELLYAAKSEGRNRTIYVELD